MSAPGMRQRLFTRLPGAGQGRSANDVPDKNSTVAEAFPDDRTGPVPRSLVRFLPTLVCSSRACEASRLLQARQHPTHRRLLTTRAEARLREHANQTVSE